MLVSASGTKLSSLLIHSQSIENWQSNCSWRKIRAENFSLLELLIGPTARLSQKIDYRLVSRQRGAVVWSVVITTTMIQGRNQRGWGGGGTLHEKNSPPPQKVGYYNT